MNDAQPAHPSRRAFLTKAGAGAAAAWTAPLILSTTARAASTDLGSSTTSSSTSVPPDGRPLLSVDPSDAPVGTIVILMMENRSFDHWLGWLADDDDYLDAGRSRYGAGFGIDGDLDQSFPSTSGPIPTAPMLDRLASGNPYRGCDHPDPGHGWTQGRAERDLGFVSAGSGNDLYALGYYRPGDLPFTSQLARRFTVCDRSFASVLGPTYPNRQYLLSGQSGGQKSNTVVSGGWPQTTIIEPLVAAGVSVGCYYADLPSIALFGARVGPYLHPIADYFTACASGTLPQVCFVDPAFLAGSRTDNHPHGDIRAGERFVRDVFAAFARSPQWASGVFFLTYDEWGGFFEHVPPPIFPDDRASAIDADNFGQAGFRIPTVVASPFARPGSVDHTVYDHTSILRFLEWRFLGAPPEGAGGSGWWLTARDRAAANIGSSLVTTPDLDVGIDLDVAIGAPSPDCVAQAETISSFRPEPPIEPPLEDKHSLEEAYDVGFFDDLGIEIRPDPMIKEWVVST